MKLTRSDIVAAAQELVDAEGLEALSMRAVAGRLNAQGSALYWHVKDKSELLTLLADGYYGRAFAAVPAGLGWRQWLIAFGHALHRELVTHRDAAHVCAVAAPDESNFATSMERFVAPLMTAGLTRARAMSCQSSVIALALGWATYEQSEPMRAHLSRVLNLQTSFRRGLEALVTGFEPSKHGAGRNAR